MAGAFAGRVVLVTGASRGIGRAAAIALGAAGAQVIAVARTVGGLEEVDDTIRAAGGPAATLVPLDLADVAGIDRLGGTINERHGRIDGLFGNAGVLGVLGPLAHVDAKTWDRTIAVNLTANFRLIRSFEPLLRKSDAGRALFVSSGASRNLRPYWGPYSVTKAALEAMVKTWAGELRTTPVKANILIPGIVRTAMRAKAMPGEDPMTLPAPETIAPAILRLLAPEFTESGVIYDAVRGTVVG